MYGLWLVVCSLLLVECCSPFVCFLFGRCSLCVVCACSCLVVVDCCMLLVVYFWLCVFAICWLLVVGCCSLSVVRGLLFVVLAFARLPVCSFVALFDRWLACFLVIRCSSLVARFCCMLFLVVRALLVVCYLLLVVRDSLCILR